MQNNFLKQSFLFLCFLFAWPVAAQQGKHGSGSVTGANTVVNEYTILTADAAAGSSLIQVNSSSLNLNGRFPNALEPGDLLFIIQLQGASISGVSVPDGNGQSFGMPKDSTWGSITAYNNCGNYEFAEVLAVPNATSISLSCPLQHAYSQAGKVQVVRVPRYSSLAVAASASITCDIWNGVIGGMVVIEVRGNVTIDGTIQTNARGFRGGLTDNSSILGSNDVAYTSPNYGGEKGEGIAGYQNDYNVVGGRYGKGAAANAGGGGTAHNAGGGGGANGGDPNQWLALGVPSLTTANWANAWNIDIPGFTSLNSTGGGRGGYTASGSNQNALTTPPGAAAWSGDFRTRQGGYGGRPLDYSTDRLFFGGGGGAGDGNDGYAGAGGRGGGLIFLDVYGQLSGSGSISSNGANGANAQGSPPLTGIAGQDGAGGGGAGGTIVIKSTQAPTLSTITANGGNGGIEDLSRGLLGPPTINQAEGPGGGGSGGVVLTSFPVPATVTGGVNGTTDSDGMTEFPPNGATSGASGSVISTFDWYDISLLPQTLCTGGNITLSPVWTGTVSQPIFEWFSQAIGGTPIASGNSFTLSNLTQDTTLYVGFCPSPFRIPVTITLTPGVSTALAGFDQTLCVGSYNLSATPPTSGTGAWTIVSGNALVTDLNDPVSPVVFNDDGTVVLEWTISATGCPSNSDLVIFTIDSLPTLANAGIDQQICGSNATLTATPVSSGSLQWNSLTAGLTIVSPANQTTAITNLSAGTNSIELVVTNGVCPSSYDTIQIESVIPSLPAFAGNDQSICGLSASISGSAPNPGTGIWTILSGSAQLSSSLTDTSTVTATGAGFVQIQWAVTNGPCPVTSDTINLTFIEPPAPISAGSDIQVCGDSVQVSISPSPITGSLQWQLLSGNGLIQNPNASTTSITQLSNGSNTFAVEYTISGCPPVSDTLNVVSDALPSSPFAGNDLTICTDSVQLSAVLPAIGNGQWSTNGVQVFNDNTNPSTVVNNLQVGINTLFWSVSNGVCPTVYDTVEISVLSILPPANAGTDFLICNDGTITLNAALPSGLNGTWTDQSGALTLSNQNDPNATALVPNSGSYVLTWTISNGVCPPNSDEVMIVAVAPASAPNAGADITTCDEYVTLSVSSSGTGFWSIASGNGNLESSTTTISGLESSPGEVLQVVWTMDNGPCPQQYDTIEVNFAGSDFAFAGIDQTVAMGDSISIGSSSAYPSVWEPSTGLNCATCPSTMASPAQTTTYVLTQSNSFGCVSMDTVVVTVELIISYFIPNAFSPNNDGNNDLFRVRALGLKNLDLHIFDRYGQEVATLSDKDASWDGTRNGKTVNPSVYAYHGTLFFLDGSTVPVQGNVQVMR